MIFSIWSPKTFHHDHSRQNSYNFRLKSIEPIPFFVTHIATAMVKYSKSSGLENYGLHSRVGTFFNFDLSLSTISFQQLKSLGLAIYNLRYLFLHKESPVEHLIGGYWAPRFSSEVGKRRKFGASHVLLVTRLQWKRFSSRNFLKWSITTLPTFLVEN